MIKKDKPHTKRRLTLCKIFVKYLVIHKKSLSKIFDLRKYRNYHISPFFCKPMKSHIKNSKEKKIYEDLLKDYLSLKNMKELKGIEEAFF